MEKNPSKSAGNKTIHVAFPTNKANHNKIITGKNKNCPTVGNNINMYDEQFMFK